MAGGVPTVFKAWVACLYIPRNDRDLSRLPDVLDAKSSGGPFVMAGLGNLVDESLCFTFGQKSRCFIGYCTPAAGAMFKDGALRRATPTIGFLSLFLLDLTLQLRIAHTHPCMSFLILLRRSLDTSRLI